MAKILNNLQVTVKNIHVRYEDKMSVPGVSIKSALIKPCVNTMSSTHSPLASRLPVSPPPP
jgi:hypothetical protein